MKNLISCAILILFVINLNAQNENVKKNLFNDPNGYFSIVKPDGWKISNYQEVSRGKVKFTNPANAKIHVITIGQPNPFDSFQSLLEDLKDSTKQMETKYKSAGILSFPSAISTFEIDDVKYAMMDVSFLNVDIKQMTMECIINNNYITFSFVAPTADFEKNLYLILECVSTITTSKDTYSAENIQAAMVESKIKQAKINIQAGKKDWALKIVEEGLAIEPTNKILLEMKNNNLATNLDEEDNQVTDVKSDQFFAILEIKPVGKILLESELKSSKISGSADQSTKHSGHDRKFISGASSFYEDPNNNRIIAAFKGDFAIGQSATKLCKEIPSSETTINSSYTVWQTEYGGLVLSTENDEDKLYYYFNLGVLEQISPFGDGAFISFKGKVVDFFEGYTFEGNEVNPLHFKLSSKTGLTYISGNGSILKENRLLKKF
jgi:hypothetical protein